MTKIKVSELTDAALDWAVAKADGTLPDASWFEGEPATYQLTYPEYSTHWSQGGPIIEREKITLDYDGAEGGVWAALFPPGPQYGDFEIGPTPLIAAMRCFVASKLGDEVEIPKELMP